MPLAQELKQLLDAEDHARESIGNQDHAAYHRAHLERMLWLKNNARRLQEVLELAHA